MREGERVRVWQGDGAPSRPIGRSGDKLAGPARRRRVRVCRAPGRRRIMLGHGRRPSVRSRQPARPAQKPRRRPDLADYLALTNKSARLGAALFADDAVPSPAGRRQSKTIPPRPGPLLVLARHACPPRSRSSVGAEIGGRPRRPIVHTHTSRRLAPLRCKWPHERPHKRD
jgi:hypothetical protein